MRVNNYMYTNCLDVGAKRSKKKSVSPKKRVPNVPLKEGKWKRGRGRGEGRGEGGAPMADDDLHAEGARMAGEQDATGSQNHVDPIRPHGRARVCVC